MSKSKSIRLFQSLRPSISSTYRISSQPIPTTTTRSFTQSTHLTAQNPNQPPSDPANFNQRSFNIERARKPGFFQAPPTQPTTGNTTSPSTTTPSAFGSLIPSRSALDPLSNLTNLSSDPSSPSSTSPQNHHLHIYAHKHNTHITLTSPTMDPLISVSAGNIGFRKAGRGSYDAAYQLTAFVMNRIQDKGLLPQIRGVEVVFRGFGAGREAVVKALLGSEGRRVRGLVVRLRDCTRLKFGGVRSKKPRRLG